MKEYFLELARYQKWANDRFREALKKLTFNDLQIKTPYGSILDLIFHIFGAVELWMKRIEGTSPKQILTSDGYSEWTLIENKWEKIDNQLITFIKNTREEDFKKEISYTSLEGLQLTTTLDNIFIQLVTHHQSYHRGQIGMILRENGLEPVKESDFIYYVYDIQK